MLSNEVYQDFLKVWYPLFFAISLISQSFLLYIIFKHTPKYLQRLKYILVNTCVFQIIHVVVCCFMQFRQVSSLVPMELWAYGPGRYLEAFIGYSLYHLLQMATFVSGISVILTLFLKYEAAMTTKLTSLKKWMIIASIISPCFLSMCMEIILIITQSLPSETRETYKLINANVVDHSVVGTLNFKVLASQINTCIMASSVILYPIVGLNSRKQILKYIQSVSERNSELKNAQNRTFVTGLTIQTFLPLFFYCPVSLIYFYCIFTREKIYKLNENPAIPHSEEEILFQQYFMLLTPAFPALCDPYITIYFVNPYRNKVREWLRLKKLTPSSVTLIISL